jgi:hypothetical protein
METPLESLLRFWEKPLGMNAEETMDRLLKQVNGIKPQAKKAGRSVQKKRTEDKRGKKKKP